MTIKFPLATTSWDQNEYDALQRVITSNMFSMGLRLKNLKNNLLNILNQNTQ